MNDLFLFMTYSGLCAVIIHRLSNNKGLRRWLLMKSAPVRGRIDFYIRTLERVDWSAVVVSAFVAFDVLLVAVTVGLIWGAK